MKLLIVMVTYNRLAYTQRTLESLLDTITGDYCYVVVDNASRDGTREWLQAQFHRENYLLCDKNLYPGKASNVGWRYGLERYPDADYLMRTDNDIEFFPDWVDKAEDYFDKIEHLGQLGLNHKMVDQAPGVQTVQYYLDGIGVTNVETRPVINSKCIITWPGSVGSPMIMRRCLWDSGLRYDETPWHHDGGDIPTIQEDAKLSTAILRSGWYFGHSEEKLAEHFVTPRDWKDYPDYYDKTLHERGYLNAMKKEVERLEAEGKL